MKIRNIVFSGFMASILMAGGAYAATGNELTTKNYVDGAYQAAVVGADSALGVHAADTNLHVTTTEKSTWNAKQSALTSPQLEAVNSGITSEVLAAAETAIEQNTSAIATLNGNSTTEGSVAYQIADALEGISAEGISALGVRLKTAEGNIEALESGKVDKVTGSSLVADTKVSAYDAHLADDDIHVTAAQKTAWTGKQDALDTNQLAAVNSGITASKVSAYDGYENTISDLETSKQDVIDDLTAIRTGAGLGATAVQPATLADYTTTAALTTLLGAKADAANLVCGAEGDLCYVNHSGQAVKISIIDAFDADALDNE